MQAIPGGVGPALPSMGGPWEGFGVARLLRRFGPLAFSASWVATGEIVATAGVSIHDVYLVNLVETYALSVASDLRVRFPIRGLWLGLDLPISITDRCSAFVEGGYYLPWTEGAGVRVGTFGAAMASAYRDQPVASDDSLGLEGRPTWWFADLGASYAFPEGLAIIAGLRYDRITASMQVAQLSGLLAQGADSLPTVDVEINSLVPYVGLHFRSGGPRVGLGITLKGFPYVFYPSLHGLSQGYFGEFKVEYGGAPEMFPDLFLRVFARGDVIHASFEADAPEAITLGNLVPSLPPPIPVRIDRGPADVTAHWQQLTVGVALSLAFAMPM
jgi:hypothetical protein